MEAKEIMTTIQKICNEHECDECPFGGVGTDYTTECPFEYGFGRTPIDWHVETKKIIKVSI